MYTQVFLEIRDFIWLAVAQLFFFFPHSFFPFFFFRSFSFRAVSFPAANCGAMGLISPRYFAALRTCQL